MPRSKVELFAATRQGSPFLPAPDRWIGAPGLHFHDLRHTGNTLAAESGASLRDLMARMGHDSMQAALIYQHRISGADQRIAAAMDAMIERKDDPGDDEDEDPDDGAAGALVPAR